MTDDLSSFSLATEPKQSVSVSISASLPPSAPLKRIKKPNLQPPGPDTDTAEVQDLFKDFILANRADPDEAEATQISFKIASEWR